MTSTPTPPRGAAPRDAVETEPLTDFVCALCDHEAGETVLLGKDRLHGVAGTWHLVRCAACGLVQLHPVPTLEQIAGFYPTDYYAYQVDASAHRDPPAGLLRRFVLRHACGYPPGAGAAPLRLVARLLAPLLPSVDRLPWHGEGRLLDVGCGAGAALLRLRAMGWRVRGVELDERAAAAGRAHGLDIHGGDLHSAQLPAASFDVVRLSHVLEHAPDPVAVLIELRRLLAPGGRLWMALPNIASANFAKYRAAWFPLELPRHLFHFSPETIRRACERAGLEVVGLRYRSSTGLLACSMQYAREDAAARRGRSPSGRPLQERRLFRPLLRPMVSLQDLRGVGELMEVTCAPAEDR